MVHALKTMPNYFRHTADGLKKFEVRKKDRPYQPGDFVALNEWKDGKYTGRCMLHKIVYVLGSSEYCKDGYVILGLEPCRIHVQEEKLSSPSDERGGIPVYDRE